MQSEKSTNSLARIRWNAEAGLSGFRNLDMASGYDCARISLGAIVRILDDLDRADDLNSVRKVRGIERGAR